MNSSDDRRVLLELFRATNGPSWRVKKGWNTGESLESWHGVAVDEDGRVVKLELPSNNLRGEALALSLLMKSQMAGTGFTASTTSVRVKSERDGLTIATAVYCIPRNRHLYDHMDVNTWRIAGRQCVLKTLSTVQKSPILILNLTLDYT